MLEKLPVAAGRVLRNVRAGLDCIAFARINLSPRLASIEVSSSAFADHGPIPKRFTADGEGLSPPLTWTDIPANSHSLVLLVEDADAPMPHPLIHAIVVALPPEDGGLFEGAMASPGHEGTGLLNGRNSFLRSGWLPPDPLPGHGKHRYAFQVFALGKHHEFSETPGRDEVLKVLQAAAVASGCLIGTYERYDRSASGSAEDAAAAKGIAPPPLSRQAQVDDARTESEHGPV